MFLTWRNILRSPEPGGGGGGGGSGGSDPQGGAPDVAKLVEAEVAKATAGLKKNNEELLADRRKWKERATGLEGELSEIKKALGAGGSTDLKSVGEMLKKARDDEERQLLQSGNIEGLIERRLKVERGNHHSQLEAVSKERDEYKQKFESIVSTNHKLVIGGAIRRHAEKAGVLPDAIDYVVRDGMEIFGLDGEEIVAKNKDGTTRYTKDSKGPYNPEAFINELKTEKPFMFLPSSGAGAGGHTNPKKPGAKEKYTLAEWQEKTGRANDADRKALVARKARGEIEVEGE